MDIPNKSIIYLVLCILGIIIFVLAGIIPQYRTMIKLDQKISRFKGGVEEEKYLLPVYESLKTKSKDKGPGLLPFPLKRGIPKEQTDTIFTTFRDIAGKSGMDIVSIIPNINSLIGNSRLLSVNIILHGNLINFRKFLTGTGDVPFLESIDEIDIQQTKEGKEYRMKILLVVS